MVHAGRVQNGEIKLDRLTDPPDNLNRLTLANAPSGTDDITYSYDLFSRQTQAVAGSQTLTWGYDQLSRNTSAGGGPGGAVSYQYDLAGDRTRIIWPGSPSFYVTYDYDLTGAVTTIKENGSTTLATYAYDDYARRTSITRGNGVTTTHNYDSSTRLSSLVQDLASTGSDQTLSYSYNASNQILTRTGSNSAYVWPQPSPSYANYTTNGLNQYPSVGGASFSYDTRGNLTSDGTTTYAYDAYNRMKTAGTATLAYDPASRLYQTAGAATTRFLYDGQEAIAEYNGSNALQRRFVFGPGVDEPIVWYEGSGTTDRRYLIANEQGSIIAVSNGSGAALNINSYDEYGQPASGNAGRFQFTGQMWLPEASLYNFKAREYSAALGRFMQTDPILQNGGMNIYAYVENDPANGADALGLGNDLQPPRGWGSEPPWDRGCGQPGAPPCPDIVVTGTKSDRSDWISPFGPILWINGDLSSIVRVGLRVCSPAENAAKQLDSQFGPNATGDPNERGAMAQGQSGSWTQGPVATGTPTSVSPPGITVASGNSFIIWHSHTAAGAGQSAPFLSGQDWEEEVSPNASNPAFAGAYLSAPSGLYGPPWNDLGAITGTINGHTATQHVYSGISPRTEPPPTLTTPTTA